MIYHIGDKVRSLIDIQLASFHKIKLKVGDIGEIVRHDFQSSWVVRVDNEDWFLDEREFELISQSFQGDFLVMKDGSVQPDLRDMNAMSTTWFEKNPGTTQSYTSFTELNDDEVEFCACLWKLPDGTVKACVTDRAHNLVEIGGVSIEVAAKVLREALRIG